MERARIYCSFRQLNNGCEKHRRGVGEGGGGVRRVLKEQQPSYCRYQHICYAQSQTVHLFHSPQCPISASVRQTAQQCMSVLWFNSYNFPTSSLLLFHSPPAQVMSQKTGECHKVITRVHFHQKNIIKALREMCCPCCSLKQRLIIPFKQHSLKPLCFNLKQTFRFFSPLSLKVTFVQYGRHSTPPQAVIF